MPNQNWKGPPKLPFFWTGPPPEKPKNTVFWRTPTADKPKQEIFWRTPPTVPRKEKPMFWKGPPPHTEQKIVWGIHTHETGRASAPLPLDDKFEVRRPTYHAHKSEEEKWDWIWPIIGAVFSVAAVALLASLMMQVPPMKPLTCRSIGRTSLTTFGTCRTD